MELTKVLHYSSKMYFEFFDKILLNNEYRLTIFDFRSSNANDFVNRNSLILVLKSNLRDKFLDLIMKESITMIRIILLLK